jgi:FixJ family two-component response regulator
MAGATTGLPQAARSVAIVDDDASVRQSLPQLLDAIGIRTTTFASAREFLDSDQAAMTSCLILDVAMPEMSGPELQRELRRRGQPLPIVFISGRTDEAMREQLLARGAVACLLKPFSFEQLRAALEQALGRV